MNKMMDAVLEHTTVRGGERMVLVILAAHCYQDTGCWPSVKRIAKLAQLTPARVRQVLASLEKRGYVQRHFQIDTKGQRSSLYTVGVPEAGLPHADTGELVKIMQRRITKTVGPVGIGAKGGLVAALGGASASTRGGLVHPLEGPPSASTSQNHEESELEGESRKAPPSDVHEVFEHHVAEASRVSGQPRRWHLTDALKRKIRERLKRFSVADLRRASTNFCEDDWADRVRFMEPGLLFKSDEKVDEWLNKVAPKRSDPGERSYQTVATARARPEKPPDKPGGVWYFSPEKWSWWWKRNPEF